MRKSLYILGQLEDQDIEWMLQTGHKLHLAPGQVLIQVNQNIDAIYIVLEGLLSVVIEQDEVAQLISGEIVGEMSFIDARPTSATVTALEASVVFSIARQHLHAKLQQDSFFAARFYRAIAVFLSYKLRDASVQLGYGKSTIHLDNDDSALLSSELLDTMHLAGMRFNQLMQKAR